MEPISKKSLNTLATDRPRASELSLLPSVALRPSFKDEDTMQIPLSTPTCTRFRTTIEMPCMICGNPMRLSLIEPRSRSNFETLTYNCAACGSDEVFLMAKKGHLGNPV